MFRGTRGPGYGPGTHATGVEEGRLLSSERCSLLSASPDCFACSSILRITKLRAVSKSGVRSIESRVDWMLNLRSLVFDLHVSLCDGDTVDDAGAVVGHEQSSVRRNSDSHRPAQNIFLGGIGHKSR